MPTFPVIDARHLHLHHRHRCRHRRHLRLPVASRLPRDSSGGHASDSVHDTLLASLSIVKHHRHPRCSCFCSFQHLNAFQHSFQHFLTVHFHAALSRLVASEQLSLVRPLWRGSRHALVCIIHHYGSDAGQLSGITNKTEHGFGRVPAPIGYYFEPGPGWEIGS